MPTVRAPFPICILNSPRSKLTALHFFTLVSVTWVAQDVPAWTLYQAAMGPDPLTEIQTRQISGEPMYLIVNLGISKKFGAIKCVSGSS